MKINVADAETLLSYAEEMVSYGYQFAAYPLKLITDSDTIQFFRTSMAAEDYCLVGSNDADYFKNIPITSLINDLNIILESGIDTFPIETIDVNDFMHLYKERNELNENNLNANTMNEKNLEYLKDQLKYTGMGETFETELKENMQKGDKDFRIIHSGIMNNGVPNNDTLTVELNFKKSDQSDIYFFNSYHVNLQKEENKPGLEQTFYINNDGTSITLKEAYNLMEGRSVNKDLKTKEGESYNAWLKMDFKESESNGNFKINHFHQNYGYDLEASLEKHSIKELQTPNYKENLMSSLKKGNLQSVTFVVNGVESKMFVEANPQFKTLNVYDGSLQRINHRESKQQKQSESKDKNVSKDGDGEPAQKEQNSTARKRKAGKSV